MYSPVLELSGEHYRNLLLLVDKPTNHLTVQYHRLSIMSRKGPIILIEDDEDDQFLIEKALKAQQLPNEIRFFSNGQLALDYFETTTEQPFLILCDINMPLMDGLELRHRINQSEYLRKKSIPFIFLTTASNPRSIELAYQESVQGFYKKSAQYTGLQEQIRLIVDYWQSCLHPNNQG